MLAQIPPARAGIGSLCFAAHIFCLFPEPCRPVPPFVWSAVPPPSPLRPLVSGCCIFPPPPTLRYLSILQQCLLSPFSRARIAHDIPTVKGKCTAKAALDSRHPVARYKTVGGGRAALPKLKGVVHVLSENDWLEVYVEMQKAAIKKLREKGVSVRMIPFSPAELCGLPKTKKVDLLNKADYIIFLREGHERF